jgi:hypothetical protein
MVCPDCGSEFDEALALAAEEDHSSDQRNGYHAMITPLARARGWSLQATKFYFLGRVFGWHEWEDLTDGVIYRVPREPHTSKLSKRKYSTLIEQTIVLSAGEGFELIPPSEWAEEQRRKQEAA